MKTLPLELSQSQKSVSLSLFEQGITKLKNGCWRWRNQGSAGYGIFCFEGRWVRANRFSHALFNGPVPAGSIVCHRCDNPYCVNPGHLFVGTHSDNQKDRFKKGRFSSSVIKASRTHLAKQLRQTMKTSKTRFEPRNIGISVATTMTERQCWDALAAKLGKRPTTMIREAMLEYLAKHAKKSPS